MGYLNSQQGIARGKLLLILFVIAVVAVVGAIMLSNQPSDQERRSTMNSEGYRPAADQFIKAMTENRPDEAYDLMTDVAKEERGGKEAWRSTVNEGFGKSKGEPKFVSAHTIEDPNGVYKNLKPMLVIYQFKQFGTDWQTSLTVIKDGDTWKIDRIETEFK